MSALKKYPDEDDDAPSRDDLGASPETIPGEDIPDPDEEVRD